MTDEQLELLRCAAINLENLEKLIPLVKQSVPFIMAKTQVEMILKEVEDAKS